MRIAVAAIVVWSGAALADPAPIPFNGADFVFHHADKINNGWASYYALPGQDPDAAHDEIIVNYMDQTDARGDVITARSLTEHMLGSVKAQGGKVVLPFSAPDPAYKNRMSYYVAFYYVYPQDRNGDIWAARTVQDTDRALGVLYKHRIDGANGAEVETRILDWLKDNMGKMPVDRLAIPPEPVHE